MTKEGGKILDLTKGRVRDQLADEADPKAINALLLRANTWAVSR